MSQNELKIFFSKSALKMTLKIFFINNRPTDPVPLYDPRVTFWWKNFYSVIFDTNFEKIFSVYSDILKKKSQNFLSGVSDENIIKNDAEKVFSTKSALPQLSLFEEKTFFVWFDYKSLNFAYLLPLKLEINNFQCGINFSNNKSKHWIDYLVYRCTLPFKS